MNIQFSGFIIFLILLLCLVISSIHGRQTIVEKFNVDKPALIYYGIDNKGIKNGLTMELIHKKNQTYSFIKTDKSLNKYLLNGGDTITDTDLIIKIIRNLDKEDVEIYVEDNFPNNYVYMFKNKCNLYIGVETFTISYLTKIDDLTDTEISPLDSIDKLKKAAEELANSFKKNEEKQNTCGTSNCCGCPNCNGKGNVITGNVVNNNNMDELSKILQNSLSGISGNILLGDHHERSELLRLLKHQDKGQYNGQDSDKYILKTAIFPVDCPNCNTIGNTTTKTTLKPTTTTLKPRDNNRKNQQFNLKLKVGLNRGHMNRGNGDRGNGDRGDHYRWDDEIRQDDDDGYEHDDRYANSMNYNGALPNRESTDFIPVNADFSAFAK